MDYNKDIHHRRSIRLNGYDYSRQGAYFITICTQNRKHLFGKIINGKIELNEAGIMIQNTWNNLPTRFDNIILDEYTIMPNHTHGIIIINQQPLKHIRTGEPCVRPHTTQYTSPNISHYIHPNPPNISHNQISENNHIGNIHTMGDHKDHPNGTQISENNHSGNIHTMGDHEDHPNGDRPRETLEGSLGRIIQAFKSITTHEYIKNVKQNGWAPFPGKLWQRDYWEHIVRDENELNRIRKYIQNNPVKWQTDKLNDKNKNIAKEISPQYGEEIWMV